MHDPITRGPLMSGGIIEVLGGVERERVGRGVLKKKKIEGQTFPSSRTKRYEGGRDGITSDFFGGCRWGGRKLLTELIIPCGTPSFIERFNCDDFSSRFFNAF
jgi:hypothetical protein